MWHVAFVGCSYGSTLFLLVFLILVFLLLLMLSLVNLFRFFGFWGIFLVKVLTEGLGLLYEYDDCSTTARCKVCMHSILVV